VPNKAESSRFFVQPQVVCTIHQPNSSITNCFDDFLLLANGKSGGIYTPDCTPAFAHHLPQSPWHASLRTPPPPKKKECDCPSGASWLSYKSYSRMCTSFAGRRHKKSIQLFEQSC
jgi:hypothetical protein